MNSSFNWNEVNTTADGDWSWNPGFRGVELVAGELEELEVPARLEHVFRHVAATPWAVTPEVLAVITDLISYRVAGHRLSADEVAERISGPSPMAARRPRGPQRSRGGAVALLSLYGVIAPRAAMVENVSGPAGTGLDAFALDLQEAVSDPEVSSIVIDINSPGGTIDMVPETASRIREARAKKPIYAVANTDAGSAAYWLASQATRVYSTPSGMVGSIGVYAAHQDLSGKHANEGRKVSLISAGRFKTEGNPFEALSEEARGALQSMVDEFYGWFVKDVAAGRGVSAADVRGGFGEGRMVPAAKALELGMIDGVQTLEEVVRNALRDGQRGGNVVSSAGDVSVQTDNTIQSPASAEEEPLEEQPAEASEGVSLDYFVSL